MSTARDYLAAVQQRADAATEGRWAVRPDGFLTCVETWPGKCPVVERGKVADHEFIAASRTDVPALVAFALAVDTARERVRRLRNEGLLTPAEAHDVLDESIRTAADKHLTPKESDS